MLPITKDYLTSRRNRPYLRNPDWYSIRTLKGVVMHWTANEGIGANAKRNRNYFNTTDRYASAHYVVDDHSIVQCMPDHEVGYHVGGKYYKPMGLAVIEDGLTPNYFLIGIEMCVNKDGDWNKTYQHSVELAQFLLNKYNFTIKDLYRHYDITGKDCPRMMIEENDWQAFRTDVNRGLTFSIGNPIKTGIVNTADLNIRTGNGIEFPVVGVLNINDEVKIYEEAGNWYRIGVDQWIHKHYVVITFSKKIGIVNDPTGLNVRSGPSVNNSIVDVLADGSEVEIFDKKERWYNIGENRWVYAPLVRIIEMKTARVNAPSFLNVRSGPGTNYEIVRRVQRDTLVTILEEEGNWSRIGEGEWVFSFYLTIVDGENA